MRKDSILLLALVILVISMFAFGSGLGMRIQRSLATPSMALAPSVNVETVSRMIARYGDSKSTETELPGLRVPVFSRYPFNIRDEVLVAAGEDAGVKVGDVALYEGAVLGTVERVFSASALVRTIFDSGYKLPVRVGSEGADALLVGGVQPQLTLIPSKSGVSDKDTVYSAAEGMPYGLGIGAIQNLHDAPDAMFKDASLRLPYDPAHLSELILVPGGK